MKNAILKTAILALGVILSMTSCSKSDSTVPVVPAGPVKPTPNPTGSNTIMLSDIQDKYFVLQKSVGKPLAVLYFVEDGGLKFYYDANGIRRMGTPVITSLDSTSGNAILTLDLNGDGSNVLQYSLSKPLGGALVVTQTNYEGSSANVLSSNMYNTADIGNRSYDGLNVTGNYVEAGVAYIDNYKFNTANCVYRKNNTGNINNLVKTWNKPYYALTGNVGFKVADPGVMGILFLKSNGKRYLLIDNEGVVREWEVI